MSKKIMIAVGARPNFMKSAALWKALKRHSCFEPFLIHTGQHYDRRMSDTFFRELELPEPDIHLGIGSGSHAEQTGRIMIAFEPVVTDMRPDLLMVVGDVNSTIACALVASKLGIPVAHVEAGLRSRDRSMPEEINRLLTDQISDLLFTTGEDADRNLIKEGIPPERIFFVGNVMIDTLQTNRAMADRSDIHTRLGLCGDGGIRDYALVTLHRPSNVDDPRVLEGLLGALSKISRRLPVLFPVHPRTLNRIQEFGLKDRLDIGTDTRRPAPAGRLTAIPPLGYLDFLALMSRAALVLSDSGGIQEETTILGIPCLTLRHNTERPITILEGTNRLVGNDPERITSAAEVILGGDIPKGRIPRYWDGRAAGRICRILKKKLEVENSV
jgi:UDP-N-acetylglucosamine 2-epimerase (non-hydrolysing)